MGVFPHSNLAFIVRNYRIYLRNSRTQEEWIVKGGRRGATFNFFLRDAQEMEYTKRKEYVYGRYRISE